LLSEGLFSITNKITCLLFNGVETLGDEKLNSFYSSAFFRASQIISASTKFAFLQKFFSLEGKIPTNFYGQ